MAAVSAIQTNLSQGKISLFLQPCVTHLQEALPALMLRRNARARAATVSEGEDALTLRQGKGSSENPFTAAHMFEDPEPTPFLLKEIVSLQFLLSSKPVFWVAEFVDYGGVDAITQFMSLFSTEYASLLSF